MAKKSNAGHPPKFRSSKEILAKAEEYFKANTIWTVSGLALHLGFVSIQSLHDYEKRAEFSDTILKIRCRLQDHIEQKLYAKGTAHGAMFWLKAQAAWRDRTEIDLTSAGQQIQASPLTIIYEEAVKEDIA